MDKYSIIITKGGHGMLLKGLLRSIRKNLKHNPPEEIFIFDYKYMHSKVNERDGPAINQGMALAKTPLVLIADIDSLIVDGKAVDELIKAIQPKDVFISSWSIESKEGVPYCYGTETMIKRELYLQSPGCDAGGIPSYSVFKWGKENNYKMINLDLNKYIFHMGQCSTIKNYDHCLNFLKRNFESWRGSYNPDIKWEDYYEDIGMEMVDLDALNYMALGNLKACIDQNKPFSSIRLGDLGLRYLLGYFWDERDFTHVGAHHPDIAVPNDKLGREMCKELTEHIREADQLDHPILYKGALNDLYEWRPKNWEADKLYKEIGVARETYITSLQAHLAFVEGFDVNFYDIIRNRKILYVGPADALSGLNERKDLQLKKKGFYGLSMADDHMVRYNVMNDFFKAYNPLDWDLVVVTGSLYGRVIIGRIKKMGGRAYDMGQAIRFRLNNVFEPSLVTNKERTYYRVIDNSTQPPVFNSYKDWKKIHRYSFEDIQKMDL